MSSLIRNIHYLDEPLLNLLYSVSNVHENDDDEKKKLYLRQLLKRAQENVSNSDEFIELVRKNRDVNPVNQQINLNKMVMIEMNKLIKNKQIWNKFRIDPETVSIDDWKTFGKSMGIVDKNSYNIKDIKLGIESIA